MWQLASEEAAGIPAHSRRVGETSDTEEPGLAKSLASGFGAPDIFGHYWVDSNAPGGPVFEWVDISGVGETVGNANNASFGPFDLGFSFPYYGDTYTQVRISDNGFITFDSVDNAPFLTNLCPVQTYLI